MRQQQDSRQAGRQAGAVAHHRPAAVAPPRPCSLCVQPASRHSRGHTLLAGAVLLQRGVQAVAALEQAEAAHEAQDGAGLLDLARHLAAGDWGEGRRECWPIRVSEGQGKAGRRGATRQPSPCPPVPGACQSPHAPVGGPGGASPPACCAPRLQSSLLPATEDAAGSARPAGGDTAAAAAAVAARRLASSRHAALPLNVLVGGEGSEPHRQPSAPAALAWPRRSSRGAPSCPAPAAGAQRGQGRRASPAPWRATRWWAALRVPRMTPSWLPGAAPGWRSEAEEELRARAGSMQLHHRRKAPPHSARDSPSHLRPGSCQDRETRRF